MQAKYRHIREEAYARGRMEFDLLTVTPTFRDFVVLYIAEGSKRNRNRVAIGNSDCELVAMSAGWLRSFSDRPLSYAVQFHADQDLAELQAHWGRVLRVDPQLIRLQRKSNSGSLGGRTWRPLYGVLTVTVSDTRLGARLQGWIDRVHESWSLDCGSLHGA